MSKLSNELEEKIQAVDKIIGQYRRQIDLLKTTIGEIDDYIEDAENEKEALEEKLNDEEAKFEPSLSVSDRNQSMGGV